MKEVASDEQFSVELKNAGKRLVVVDFFATWCGPCKILTPHLEQMSKDFPTVVFLKVDVDICEATAASQGIQAMPTINFYVASNKVDSVRGCNPDAIKSAIQKWLSSDRVDSFPEQGGVKLGGDGSTGTGTGTTGGSSGTVKTGMDPEVVNQLLDMGFSEFRAKKAAAESATSSLEAAMDWLIANQDRLELEEATALSMEVDEPKGSSPPQPEKASAAEPTATSGTPVDATPKSDAGQPAENGGVAKSLKCNECGKLFKSEEDVEFHAVKSGHVDFAESTEEVKPLTEEEKKAKLALLEKKMAEKKAVKAEEERRQAIEMEKKRRAQGQELSAAKLRLEQEEMKKIADERRRQKREDALLKQRLLDQIKKDREDKAKEASAAKNPDAQPPPAVTPAQPVVEPAKPKDYSSCRLQIRLTNGEALTQEFDAKETLAHVRVYVEQHRTDGDTPFKFMTTFPRKIYADDDMDTPLQVLGLVPSAVLILSKTT